MAIVPPRLFSASEGRRRCGKGTPLAMTCRRRRGEFATFQSQATLPLPRARSHRAARGARLRRPSREPILQARILDSRKRHWPGEGAPCLSSMAHTAFLLCCSGYARPERF
jgi:hypothetical protein